MTTTVSSSPIVVKTEQAKTALYKASFQSFGFLTKRIIEGAVVTLAKMQKVYSAMISVF